MYETNGKKIPKDIYQANWRDEVRGDTLGHFKISFFLFRSRNFFYRIVFPAR